MKNQTVEIVKALVQDTGRELNFYPVGGGKSAAAGGGQNHDTLCGSGAEGLRTLIEALKTALKRGEKILVGIDGRCGSGKTTLAQALAQALGQAMSLNVFSLDNYYLPQEERLKRTDLSCGKNLDRARIFSEIILPFQRGQHFTTRRFDCALSALLPPEILPFSGVAVIEGAYCFSDYLNLPLNLKVMTHCSFEERLKRLALREGKEKLEVFKNVWIPWEEKYFAGLKKSDGPFIDIEI